MYRTWLSRQGTQLRRSARVEEREDRSHRVRGRNRRRPQDHLNLRVSAGGEGADAIRDGLGRAANGRRQGVGSTRDLGRLDDDPGRSADGGRIPPVLDTGSLERGDSRPELLEVTPLFDVSAPDVRMAHSQLQHPRALGADHDRDLSGTWTHGSMLEIPGSVIGPLEVGTPFAQ